MNPFRPTCSRLVFKHFKSLCNSVGQENAAKWAEQITYELSHLGECIRHPEIGLLQIQRG